MPGTLPVINNPTPPGGQLFASEQSLPQGSAPNPGGVTRGWTFSISAEDGIGDLTIGGFTAISAGVFTAGRVDVGFGYLSIDSYDAASGQVAVSFTITGPHHSPNPGAQQKYGDFQSFQVVLTDRDGDSATSSLAVQIRDDETLALSSDSATVTVGGAVTGNLVTGGTPDRFTADGFGQIVQISPRDWTNADTTPDAQGRFSVTGQYGVLTVAPNGDYTYTPNAGAPAGVTDGFTYWATDGDGDRSNANLTITLQAGSQPPSGEGQVITSPGPGSTLAGGSGNDTLIASQGADVLTGGAGADAFAFKALPWSAGRITDFVVGADRLDLSAIFQSSGYTGVDPIADGRLTLQSDGAGGTKVLFDRDAPNTGDWPFHVTTLQGVSPVGLTWAQLSGGTTSSPPAGAVTFSVTPTSISQAEGGADGVTEYLFTVTRNGSTAGVMSVDYTSAGVGPNPTSPDDFWSTGGVLRFGDGQASATALIRVRGDGAAEADETFELKLLNVTTSGSPATGTIRNDDTAQPPPSGDGQVITSSGPGASVTGGSGNDTLIASQGADVLTGNGGADSFAFRVLPWSAGRITDFTVGTDRLDLTAIFQSSGYTGADPIADGRVTLQSDGSGGTKVFFDRDAPNTGDWPFHVTTLQNVGPAELTWAKLSGGAASPPPSGGSEIRFLSAAASGTEGSSGGTSSFGLTVQRTDSQGPASVEWRLTPSGANPVDASDFIGGMPVTGVVTFNAGEQVRYIVLTVNADTTAEPDETFTLQLSNAQGGVLGQSTQVVTIRNDDAAQQPAAADGQVLTSDQYGDVLTGGAGNDTLIAGQGPDKLTGAGGEDRFVFDKLPWVRGEISDFTPGEDLLDLSALAPGYAGSDPVRDGVLQFRDVGGATEVFVDRDGAGGDWPIGVTLLRGVTPSQLGASDWLF
ncbi:M10 family metallopeptidase C-terminal domain-containing protein [Phenylobacterium sp.]|uniref:M10 family metallopeptidase C-terminal domain-containing protein n=1 Tax=Phenylobacterium sp. TaxID=1871053 RepID=UPI0035B0944F